ncbi:glutamate-cysteine ligase family protein [Cryobacterium sp. Y50]|uniref:glutamate-cysteine ligase family protein n=1 Tax=Cryobacterium sp. Y50 TaxID=2048286 RepID=UPI0011AFDB4B
MQLSQTGDTSAGKRRRRGTRGTSLITSSTGCTYTSAFRTARAGVQALNRVHVWLPTLLALAVNSPF